jgi:hypothetical protein
MKRSCSILLGDLLDLDFCMCTNLRRNELAQVVALFKELGKAITQAEADKMIAEVDANSDGKVSFDEFCVVSFQLSFVRNRWSQAWLAHTLTHCNHDVLTFRCSGRPRVA